MRAAGEETPWYQIGITSFGSQGCARSDDPTVYTRVSAYADWISSKIEGAKCVDPQGKRSTRRVGRGLYDTYCQLPYTFNGEVFTSCLSYSEQDAWCPREIDNNGIGVRWLRCSSDCPSTGKSAYL